MFHMQFGCLIKKKTKKYSPNVLGVWNKLHPRFLSNLVGLTRAQVCFVMLHGCCSSKTVSIVQSLALEHVLFENENRRYVVSIDVLRVASCLRCTLLSLAKCYYYYYTHV